jgi:glycosyltransferase involved in cell wall biosynthesis
MVSVLMTAYNREKYIAESIESVLKQTYSNFELIIVDDNSTDRTKEIILSYSKFNKIRYYFNDINLGEYQNRNKAASYARGKYLKYLDSDDLMDKDCLSIMVNQMEKYPEAAIGLISYFDENLHKKKSLLNPNELYKEFYFKGNLINCGPSSTIIRKNVFDNECGYRLEPYLSDTDFIFRVSAKHHAVIFSKSLVFWRQHLEQEYEYAKKLNFFSKNSYTYFKYYLNYKYNPLSQNEISIALRNLKNRYSRKVFKKVLKFQFSSAIDDTRLYDLRIRDLFFSVFPNNYPNLN